MDGREAMPERTAGKSSFFYKFLSKRRCSNLGENAGEIGKVGQLAGWVNGRTLPR